MSKPEFKISFPISTVLFTVFLTLKLAGVITWSWWWVTAPLWIPILAVVSVLGVLAVVAVVAAVLCK